METSEIFETEASVYVPVCAVLLQSQRLEVNLNALVDTMAGTATGMSLSLSHSLSLIYKTKNKNNS